MRRLTSLVLLVSAGLLASSFCDERQGKPKMNVLFIIADDLNCNIGAYGHYLVRTPNIDRLASQGVLFTDAFCNFPLCGPSRASLLTGMYPDQTGHHKLRDLIRDHVPDAVTLPQNFMNHGYHVARVGKLFHYDNPKDIGTPGHDDSVSWHERYYPRGIDKDMEDQIVTLRPNAFGATLSWLAADGEDEQHTDGKVASKAVELLKRYAKDNTPFFLGVGFYKPHTPFVAPRKYFEWYPTDSIRVPEVQDGYLESLPEPARNTLLSYKEQVDLPDSLARSAIQAYFATISFLDAQVGRVMDALDSLGLRDNTLVVFTSDHGYHMGEHGYYQKNTLFEDAGRIPLIVSVPDMPNRSVLSHSIVEMIDFYPTLSDCAGLSLPPYMAGRSFKPLLSDVRKPFRSSALSQVVGGYTIRTQDYRYSRWGEGGAGMLELYDRQADPEERANLAARAGYEDIIRSLDRLLNERIAEAGKAPKGLNVVKHFQK